MTAATTQGPAAAHCAMRRRCAVGLLPQAKTKLLLALLVLLLGVLRLGSCSSHRSLMQQEQQQPQQQQQQESSNKPLAQPDYSLYLKKTDLLARVREVVSRHPETMKYETRHAKDGDYKADILVVTVEPSGLSPTHKSKARLLLDFGEHGREFITSEVGLKLLEVLGDAEQLSRLVGGGKRAARLQAILQHCVFKVLPMENVAGRDLVEGGNLCERKNGRGVDPNRNWDIDWGVKEKDYDPKEEFPGRAPLSEPEVQVLLALAKELHPHVWLNVHSGMYALFTPYDHKGHVPNTTDARAALRLLKRIQDLVCPQCKVGSGGHTVGYLAHGTATDYMFEVLKIPMSFTWEIYGDESASYDDCFRMFNPLGKQAFEEVSTLWVKALLQLIELLPTHPATWPYFKKLGLDRWEAVVPEQQQKTQQPQADSNASQQQQQQEQKQEEKQSGVPAATPAAATTAAPSSSSEGQGAAPVATTPAADQQQQQQMQPTAVSLMPHKQQQQQQPPSSSADSSSTEVSIEEHLQSGRSGGSSSRSSRGQDWALVLMSRVLPWALGVAGFAGVLYVVTRTSSGGGVSYRRLPITRQPGVLR